MSGTRLVCRRETVKLVGAAVQGAVVPPGRPSFRP